MSRIAYDPRGQVEQRVRCPDCGRGRRDATLGVNVHTGAYHCFRCGLRGRLGGAERAGTAPVPMHDPAAAERKRQRLRRAWESAVPLTDGRAAVVRTYLEARGLAAILDAPPQCLRASRMTYYHGQESLGEYPVMLAVVTAADGAPVTLHATYLRSDGSGKAAVPAPKKLLPVPIRGATRGGAIRLYPTARGTLGVAEGIESALSLQLIEGVPVWAAISAGNMAALRIPPIRGRLLIGVDSDGPGQSAAQALAQRILAWRFPPAVYLVEPERGGDLNEEIQEVRRGQG